MWIASVCYVVNFIQDKIHRLTSFLRQIGMGGVIKKTKLTRLKTTNKQLVTVNSHHFQEEVDEVAATVGKILANSLNC